MQSQLEKAINLSKKTGDRIIVVDKNNVDNVFVLMSFDEYEKLALVKNRKSSEIKGLTEMELIDKINRDIAIWKSDQEDSKYSLNSDDFCLDFDENEDIENEDDNLYYYGEDEDSDDISEIINNNYQFPFEDNDVDDIAEFKRNKDKEENVKSFKDIVKDRYNYSFDEEEKKNEKNLWKIPSNVKKIAEEVIED